MIKGSPVYDNAIEYVKNQIAIIENSKKIKKNKNNAQLIFLGAPHSLIKYDIWKDIYEAIKSKTLIVLEYHSVNSRKIDKYCIKPFQLIFDNGSWEVWGDCSKPDHEGRKLFNLSRIKNVKTLTDIKKFELPSDFDFRLKLHGNFGCYTDGKKVRYKILLKKDSYAQIYTNERVWGDDQEVESSKQGTILSFTANQYNPILRWVLSWGPDVQPLEPKKLVDDWKQKILEMGKMI